MHLCRTAASAAIAVCAATASAQAQEDTPRGVNPKDNLNKLELIYKGDRLDGSRRIDAFTAKYDRAFTPQLGANLEVPLVRFASPGFSEFGLGDVQFRVRYNVPWGAVTLIPGVEVVAPSASDDVLGAGKWQLNPVLGAVLSPTPTTFVFAGYKHLRSVAGDSARPDINASQPRLIVGKLSPAGWWVLGDTKYTYDYGTRLSTLDVEFEAGQMLSARMGVSARLGTSALDSARNASASLNLRILF